MVTTRHRIVTFLFLASVGGVAPIAAAGTVEVAPNANPPTREMSFGTVATEGVTIEAEDGSFTLRYGETFEPPYQFDSVKWVQVAGPYTFYVLAKAFPYTGSPVNHYGNALKYGAKRVRVTTPLTDTPLHGVLYFGKPHLKATDPASTSYYIQVPDQFVRAALDGRVSAVYETTSFSTPWFTWADTEPKSTTAYTLILWMSKTPVF